MVVRCRCGKSLRVQDSMAGKRVRCPGCGKPVAVPAPEADIRIVEEERAPAPASPRGGPLWRPARVPERRGGLVQNALGGIGLVVLLLVLGGGGWLAYSWVSGKKRTEQAVEFNDRLAGYNKKLETVGRKFGTQLAEVLKVHPYQTAGLQGTRDESAWTIESISSDVRMLRVPSGASGEELYRAYLAHLKTQQAIVSSEFHTILRILDDPQAGPAEAPRQVQEVLQRIKKSGEKEFERLTAAQRKFAAEHGIQLR